MKRVIDRQDRKSPDNSRWRQGIALSVLFTWAALRGTRSAQEHCACCAACSVAICLILLLNKGTIVANWPASAAGGVVC